MKRLALKWLVVWPRFVLAGGLLLIGAAFLIVGGLFSITSRLLDESAYRELDEALREIFE